MLKYTAHTYRQAYTGLSKETWLLSLIMMINRSGTMVIPFMTLYLTSEDMGFSLGDAGIVFGLFGAGAFAGAWLGGKLTDKIGFYPVQLFTLITGGLLFMVLGQMKSFPLICSFTFLLSFVNEAFRPANSTAIAFYCKESNRTRSYALNRLAINLGWAVGLTLGGFIADFNYELLFWVDGFTNIGAAVLMALLLRPVNYKPIPQIKKEHSLSRSAYKDKTYLSFTLITILFASCFFQIFNNLPVYFSDELHFSKPFIGILMASNGILIALMEMVIIYKLEGRKKHMTYITAGVTMVGISFLLLNIPGFPIFTAIAMNILFSLGEMLSMPFMNSYWIARTNTSNRGQYAALYTMAWSAAQTIGPVAGSQIAEHAGFRILWWAVGGVSLCAAFAFYKWHGRAV